MHTARLLIVSPSMHCAGGCLLGGCLVLGGVCFGGVPGPGGVVSQHTLRQTPPPCEQNSWHMLLKILPWPQTSFAGGNNVMGSPFSDCAKQCFEITRKINASRLQWAVTSYSWNWRTITMISWPHDAHFIFSTGYILQNRNIVIMYKRRPYIS